MFGLKRLILKVAELHVGANSAVSLSCSWSVDGQGTQRNHRSKDSNVRSHYLSPSSFACLPP